MRRIEHRTAVEENQVLVCRTASHVIAARGLADGGDAWQREYHLHDVRLTKGRRDVLQQLGFELLRAHDRALHRRLPAGYDDDLCQFLVVSDTGLGLLNAWYDIGLCICRPHCHQRVTVQDGNAGDQRVDGELRTEN